MRIKYNVQIALVLAVAVLLGTMHVEAFASTAVPSEITVPGLKVGEDLIDASVSAGDAIPSHETSGWVQDEDAWSYGMPKGGTPSWGWWRGKGDYSYSASVTSDNIISLSAYNTDSIILLPKLPSTNYMFEATFTVEGEEDPNGSFGLITNIAPEYTKSIGATMFVAYAAGANKGTVYTWNKAKSANIGTELYEKNRTSKTVSNYIPDYTAPGVGDSIKLTAYVYEGTNYYYVNDVFVTSAVSKFITEGESLCGFFCSGNTATSVAISDISVKELIISEDDDSKEDSDGGDGESGSESGGESSGGSESGGDVTGGDGENSGGSESSGEVTGGDGGTSDEDIPGSSETPEELVFDGSYTIGSVIYETDFDEETVAGLPEGWQAGNKADGTSSFGWADSDASMVAEVAALEGYGNVLHFGSVNTDAYITAPDTGTLDYIFEANVIVNFDTKGEFGLANDFYAGVNDADGCMYNSSFIDETLKESTWKYRSGNGSTKGTWTFSYYPKKGDMVKLKVISYDGMNYIYCNDVLSAIADQRNVKSGVVVSSDNPGFFTYGGDIYITDVKITAIHYDKAELVIDNASLSVADDGKVGIDVAFSFDKSQEIYAKYITGDYVYSDSSDLKFGAAVAVGSSQVPEAIEVSTEGVTHTVFTTCTQDDDKIEFVYSISDIPEENYDRFYTVRPYCLAAGTYFYGEAKAYSAAELANGIYAFTDDDVLKDSLDAIFTDSNVFVGKNAASLTFTLFADFHYKAGMYSTTIADLEAILKRADTSESAFIMSAGDITNDAIGSPELFKTYLNYYTEEGKLLPAYNIYGNHELEGTGNSMDVVTPTLTNSDVVWGTETGEMVNSIGYYYFESEGFRIVCIDTQYSYDPITGEWEHNPTKSYGAPSGNTNKNSLGPVQLTWLEEVLTDAAENDIPCIVVGHDGFSGLGWSTTSADASAVRTIFKKANDLNPGTVLMCINGHVHTNHQGYNEGVFYLDTNTVRNGWWQSTSVEHYTSEHTYEYQEYDANGNPVGEVTSKALSSLSQAKKTWFFEDPLSAVITIDEYGVISIDGAQSTWAYGIEPASVTKTGVEPLISSGTYWSCDILGHDMVWQSDDTYHWSSECSNTLCNEVIERTAHSYGEWSVVKEATVSETGLKERKCITCQEPQTEVIPVIKNEESKSEEAPSVPDGEDGTNVPDNEETPDESGSEDTSNTPESEEVPSASESEDRQENDSNTSENEDAYENNMDTSEDEDVPATSTNVPATGDDSNLARWLVIIILGSAALSIAAVLSYRKRKQ